MTQQLTYIYQRIKRKEAEEENEEQNEVKSTHGLAKLNYEDKSEKFGKVRWRPRNTGYR